MLTLLVPYTKICIRSIFLEIKDIYFDFKDMNAARGIKFAGPHYLNTLKTPAEVMPFK